MSCCRKGTFFSNQSYLLLNSGGAGLEPTTIGFGDHYSTKLNYPPFKVTLNATPLHEITFKKFAKTSKSISSKITNLL